MIVKPTIYALCALGFLWALFSDSSARIPFTTSNPNGEHVQFTLVAQKKGSVACGGYFASCSKFFEACLRSCVKIYSAPGQQTQQPAGLKGCIECCITTEKVSAGSKGGPKAC